MLRSLMEDLRGCPVMASDGFIGVVCDAYFDDRWTVRYLSLQHGDHQQLVSAEWISDRRTGRAGMALAISADDVEGAMTADAVQKGEENATARDAVRSACEAAGYSMTARDGGVGSLRDFIVDDRNWHITDLVADTRSWLPGKPRLISPDAVDWIDPGRHAICIRLTREEVEHSPRAP